MNNNKTKIECSIKTLIKLREHKYFAIRAEGAFYTEAFRRRRWDGIVRYITERGIIDTGKVPQLVGVLELMGKKIHINDDRDKIKPLEIPIDLNGTPLRDYQKDAIEAILYNTINGIPFPRGVIAAATNAGKTVIAAGIHVTFNNKTLLLLNSLELFNDMMIEMPKLLPGKVGWICSKEIIWNDFKFYWIFFLLPLRH